MPHFKITFERIVTIYEECAIEIEADSMEYANARGAAIAEGDDQEHEIEFRERGAFYGGTGITEVVEFTPVAQVDAP